MSDDAVKKERLRGAAQDLNVIVVSLDRIGSANAESGRAQLAAALLDFYDDWNVFARLATAREILFDLLLEGLPESDLCAAEEELDRGPYWGDS